MYIHRYCDKHCSSNEIQICCHNRCGTTDQQTDEQYITWWLSKIKIHKCNLVLCKCFIYWTVHVFKRDVPLWWRHTKKRVKTDSHNYVHPIAAQKSLMNPADLTKNVKLRSQPYTPIQTVIQRAVQDNFHLEIQFCLILAFCTKSKHAALSLCNNKT